MIHTLAFLLLVSLNLLKYTEAYDFSESSCSATLRQQSPINIDPDNSLYFDEKYFRFLTNNYEELTTEHKWEYFQEEKAIGVGPINATDTLGSFTFVKDWAMYSFELKKILFRVNSEHKINGNSFDVEMQLIHTIDPTYYPPGRRINLGVENLVISIFFQKSEDKYPGNTKLFEFMNLEGFQNGTSPNMARNIKLHYMVQHQPSFLYEGTLTYPECQPALWLVYSQYHLIGASELEILTKAIQKTEENIVDTGTQLNTRDVFPTISNVYRNWNEMTKLVPRPNLMVYNSSSFLNLSFAVYISLTLSLLLIFF